MRVKDIKSFIYGGLSSRFWMMRKHINSIEKQEDKLKLPFFSWQCISIQEWGKTVDLVIPNADEMFGLIKFLLLSLKSVDGCRDTALPYIDYMMYKTLKLRKKKNQSYNDQEEIQEN